MAINDFFIPLSYADKQGVYANEAKGEALRFFAKLRLIFLILPQFSTPYSALCVKHFSSPLLSAFAVQARERAIEAP